MKNLLPIKFLFNQTPEQSFEQIAGSDPLCIGQNFPHKQIKTRYEVLPKHTLLLARTNLSLSPKEKVCHRDMILPPDHVLHLC